MIDNRCLPVLVCWHKCLYVTQHREKTSRKLKLRAVEVTVRTPPPCSFVRGTFWNQTVEFRFVGFIIRLKAAGTANLPHGKESNDQCGSPRGGTK